MELLAVDDNLHALASATADGLNEYRVADLVCLDQERVGELSVGRGRRRGVPAGNARDAGTEHDLRKLASESRLKISQEYSLTSFDSLWTKKLSAGHSGESEGWTNALEPIEMIALAGGPINVIPASASVCENLAFSLRKPYPG